MKIIFSIAAVFAAAIIYCTLGAALSHNCERRCVEAGFDIGGNRLFNPFYCACWNGLKCREVSRTIPPGHAVELP